MWRSTRRTIFASGPFFILDKDVDDIDTVLKRLTYMSDMEAEGFGIYVDGRLFVTCESRAAAKRCWKTYSRNI